MRLHETPQGKNIWHEMGKSIKDAETMEEAIEMSGLDYNVAKAKVHIPTVENTGELGEVLTESAEISEGMQPVPGAFATRREDTGAPLGVVGSQYTIIQNKYAFQLFDPLLRSGDLELDHAGLMAQAGERIWLLARVGDPIFLTSEDSLEQYITLLNSHDGSMALRVINTPVRVSSGATAIAALKKGGTSNTMSIRHTTNAKKRLMLAQDIIKGSLYYYSCFAEAAGEMIKKSFRYNDVEKILSSLFPCKFDGDTPVYSARALNQMQTIRDIFDEEPLQTVRGSAWSLYGAITEFVDYHRSPSNTDSQKYRRLQSISDGSGAELKKKAFKEIMATV